MALTQDELNELHRAKLLLETPGLAARVSSMVGSPIESGLKKLPAPVQSAIGAIAQKSVEKALDLALMTLDGKPSPNSSNLLHKLAVGASGAAGGAFGMSALAIELPVSTTIMLRSIADIARSEGEDLSLPDARLQCLQVLALGGSGKGDDGAEAGYFAVRAALAKAVSDAAAHLAAHGFSQSGAPAIVRLITGISSRFSAVVSQKAAAQALPLVGALGGAAVNALFLQHFQDTGRGHFIVRRLERLHGQEVVRRHYEQL